MSLRAVVVDDEHIARARMRRLLQVVGANAIEVIGECVNVAELHELAADCEIDVVFLDIKMPDGSGFDALAQWPGKKMCIRDRYRRERPALFEDAQAAWLDEGDGS